MKNLIVVTGGAGFVGSNLIRKFISKTSYNIISIDNYSTGSKKNHIKNSRIIYLEDETENIAKLLSRKKKKIRAIFHFGEFSRIYQSFLKMSSCIKSNSIGSNAVFNFCLTNKIKLIYSATSASIGNKGNDKNLSPYAFSKAKNLEFLNNLNKWFGFKFEVIYFYNVYGPNQICTGDMATVIGIFEEQYKNKKPLTIVKPGSQSRKFTHIDDTVEACYYAWKQNKNRHYSISSKQSYTIKEVANMFNSKVKYLPSRPGERYASALTSFNLTNKVHKLFGKIKLIDYVNNIIKSS